MDDLSSNKGLIQSNKLIFSTYQEDDETMFNESVATAFAEIQHTRSGIGFVTNSLVDWRRSIGGR